MIEKLYWWKTSDTQADALEVAGLAKLAASIGRPTVPRKVVVTDRGDRYVLTVVPPIEESEVKAWDGDPFYPYVRLKDDRTKLALGREVIEYEAESEILAEARASKAKGTRKGTKTHRSMGAAGSSAGGVSRGDVEAEAERAAAKTPHAEIALLRTWNGMRKGFKTDIAFHAAIGGAPPRDALLERLRLHSADAPPTSAFAATLPSDLAGLKLSASQWFQPIAGKGVWRTKPTGTSAAQIPKDLVDWFSSWLRFIGMYESLTSHGLGEDLKLSVLAPRELPSGALKPLRARIDALRAHQKKSGAQIEVRLILGVTKALIELSEEYALEAGRLRFVKGSPREVLRGLHVTTYKKMGTASSVVNVAFLGIPAWFGIATRVDALAWLDALGNLDQFQRQFDEDRSDSIKLHRALRDALSTDTLDATLELFGVAASAVAQRAAGKGFTSFLEVTTVRRMLMGFGPDVQRIVDDPGFQAIAKAIRRATIHAQIYEDSKLTPQYGLAQKWRQNAADKGRFMELLASFVQDFNASVVRLREVARSRGAGDEEARFPALVLEDELRAVIRLIELPQSSSSLVCHLLLGFGYAQTRSQTQKSGETTDGPATER
jgi:hypothetical protein